MFASGFHGLLRSGRTGRREKAEEYAKNIYERGHSQEAGVREEFDTGHWRM
jgi:hypothetical protein